MMAGLLLARAGIKVLILEKHADFLRDFRGDTVHPSTLQVMRELGLFEEFLERPHQKVTELQVQIGNNTVKVANFSGLPAPCNFVAFMPQWDFLDFLAAQGRRYPGFAIRMQAEVKDVIQERERYGAQVRGVVASTPQGSLEVRADLIIGADGRGSVVRQRAGLKVHDLGAPMDVLWMRLPKHPDDPGQVFGTIQPGRIFIRFDRGDYWQCAFVIPKGGMEQIKADGLDRFRAAIGELAPFLRDRLDGLTWEEVKLLTVRVDRLERWYRPGLLMIGDAAHAMSPIGGVGINLAIQDAVAAANLLSGPLAKRIVSVQDLQKVQKRREFPTVMTQRAQLFIQNQVIGRALQRDRAPSALWLLHALQRFPALSGLTGRLIGWGVRPEHVQSGP